MKMYQEEGTYLFSFQLLFMFQPSVNSFFSARIHYRISRFLFGVLLLSPSP